MTRTAIAQVRIGEAVAIAGRVVGIGTAVGLRWLRMRDESGEIDVELEPDVVLPPEGALARVEGIVARSERATSGVCLRGRRIDVVGTPSLLPDEEPEWEAPAWRPRWRELVARDRLLRTLRGWFHEQGFLEVETRTLLQAPGQEPHLLPFVTAFHGRDGARKLWLATSPEYAMKRLLAVGFERIFQLGRSFRDGRDESSPLHAPEFTMVEWYRAWEPLGAIGHDVEALLRATATTLRGTTSIERGGNTCDVGQRARWLSVEEAFRDLADVDLEPYLEGDDAGFVASLPASVRRVGSTPSQQADSVYFRLLIERIEPKLGIERPVFLCRYPARHAALAELCADDPRVAERFEAYVLGIELANAFQELRDPVEQERRLRAEQAERALAGHSALPLDEEFLRALRSGLPPCAGIALGVDRLHLLITGAARLDDVLPFPFSTT